MDINVFNDKKLAEVFDRYSPEEVKAGENMLETLSRAVGSEIIVPVLGLQGMGKSTLINAILAEDIMPVEADETTCVPVEIKYGDEPHCEVYFKGSDRIEKAVTKEDLAQYVDNNFNPANKKKVSHITVYRSAEILKNGMVLVDLPGMGSLTAENANTTMRYIENLCTAIFIIPTTPVIRRSEAAFIRAVWSQFPTAIFVQNAWEGEAPINIKDASVFNKSALKEISLTINNTFNEDEDLTVVNVYGAAYGRINKDKKRTEASGILKLTERLKTLTDHWADNMKNGLENRVKNLFISTKAAIENKREEIGKSASEILQKRREVMDRFDKTTKELTQKIYAIEDDVDSRRSEFYDLADKLSKNCMDNIRAGIYPVIDGGITDGDKLNRAFKDIQSNEVPYAADEAIKGFASLKSEVMEQLEDMDNITDSVNISIEEINFNKKHRFKWEKGANVLINIGGGIGGYFAGAAITPAVTAALAGVGAAAGPIGFAVGLVAGLAITGIVSLLSGAGKNAVVAADASNTKRLIDREIAKIGRELKNSIIDGYESTRKCIEDSLEDYIDMRNDYIDQQKEAELGEIEVPESDEQLIKDLKFLEEMEEKYDI